MFDLFLTHHCAMSDLQNVGPDFTWQEDVHVVYCQVYKCLCGNKHVYSSPLVNEDMMGGPQGIGVTRNEATRKMCDKPTVGTLNKPSEITESRSLNM